MRYPIVTSFDVFRLEGGQQVSPHPVLSRATFTEAVNAADDWQDDAPRWNYDGRTIGYAIVKTTSQIVYETGKRA